MRMQHTLICFVAQREEFTSCLMNVYKHECKSSGGRNKHELLTQQDILNL